MSADQNLETQEKYTFSKNHIGKKSRGRWFYSSTKEGYNMCTLFHSLRNSSVSKNEC